MNSGTIETVVKSGLAKIIGGGAQQYGIPCAAFHLNSTSALSANNVRYLPVYLKYPITLLYSLCRYQRECTWFEGDKLAELAKNTDSKNLEAVMDAHLRAWLFREGIDFPFSTPSGPSGRADVVIWDGERPLPIEVKVFDGANRDTGHVAQGLWQAHRYAVDYGLPFGYLVVFNTSPHLLAFDGNVQKDGPPWVVVSGMNIFAIVINVGENRATASKEKPLETKLVKTPGSSEG